MWLTGGGVIANNFTMYTTIIHPLRKMYNLSINEYCVLEAIKNLSNNKKYEGWCVLPQDKLAKALDLSVKTIQRSYKKLEEVGLATRRWSTKGDTAIRPSDEWNEWFMPEKAHLLLGMKTNNEEIVAFIPNSGVHPLDKMSTPPSQIVQASPVKMSTNTNKDTNKDIIKEKIYKKEKFVKPSIGQIQEYCKERKNNINAEQFHDYYQSKGWKVGKTAMKDWKAAIRTWERSSFQKQSAKPKLEPVWRAPEVDPVGLEKLAQLKKQFGEKFTS
jgi:hypothetical protein